MTRVIGLPEYLEHQAYFGKTFSAKYIKLYIRKTMLSAFFISSEYSVHFRTYCILLTAYIVHRQILRHILVI